MFNNTISLFWLLSLWELRFKIYLCDLSMENTLSQEFFIELYALGIIHTGAGLWR